MELLLRVQVDIVEVIFEDDGGFENLTVGFAGETTLDLIGELLAAIGSVLDLKIGFTFNGVFHADSDSVGDFAGSSAWFSVNLGVLEGFFDNFDNFG